MSPSKRSDSFSSDTTPPVTAADLKFSSDFNEQQIKWTERLHGIIDKLKKLEERDGKNNSRDKDILYVESELLRMDYLEVPEIDAYITARNKAQDDNIKKTIMDLSQGKMIESWITEHDDIRKRFKLPAIADNGPQTILRMILAIVYTLLLMPFFFLAMPSRLIHPMLRSMGLKNNYLPIDMVQKWYARSFLAVCGVTVSFEGLENLDTSSGTIGMFTHASNLDPYIVASGPLAFKWIGKKQLFQIPLFGWLLAGWGHISIDRSNRTAAIASLDSAVQKIHTWGRNIAISPEGQRSTTGRLLDFKKGPFHIATQVGNPITPMLLFHAYELWSPHQIFAKPGHVTVRFLPQIPVSKADTPHTLELRVRRAILNGLAIPTNPKLASAQKFTNPIRDLLFLPIVYIFIGLLYKFIQYNYF